MLPWDPTPDTDVPIASLATRGAGWLALAPGAAHDDIGLDTGGTLPARHNVTVEAVGTNTGRPEFDPAAYGNAFADVYDEWYGGLGGVDSLVDLISAGGMSRRVLELGAGTGRLAIPLAAAGHRVVAFDSSPAMLDRLRQSLDAAGVGEHRRHMSLDPILGDAAIPNDFPEGPFDVLLLAFNFLFNLADRPAQRTCLVASAGRLAPDGVVIVECLVPSLPSTVEHRRVAREVIPGRTVEIETSVDPATSVIEGTHITDVRRSWRLCVASVHEVDELAATAGLHLLSRTADWDGAPFLDDESDRHVSIYGRRR